MKRNYVHKYGAQLNKPKVHRDKTKYTRKQKHKGQHTKALSTKIFSMLAGWWNWDTQET